MRVFLPMLTKIIPILMKRQYKRRRYLALKYRKMWKTQDCDRKGFKEKTGLAQAVKLGEFSESTVILLHEGKNNIRLSVPNISLHWRYG